MVADLDREALRDRHDAGLADDDVAAGFAALGAPVRLSIVRLLVRAGEAGLPVGAVQSELDMAASTLTHHLKALAAAGLVTQTRQGRTLVCRAGFERLRSLGDRLLQDCCRDEGGHA